MLRPLALHERPGYAVALHADAPAVSGREFHHNVPATALAYWLASDLGVPNVGGAFALEQVRRDGGGPPKFTGCGVVCDALAQLGYGRARVVAVLDAHRGS